MQPEIATNFEASLNVLREFATTEEVDLPDLPYNSVADMVIACEAAAAHEDLVRSGRWRICSIRMTSGASIRT